MQQLQWAELYENKGLADDLERWRDEWKSEYDFILIDSRTGVTDIGSLCTVHLPDILIFFFMANHQSLDGAIEFVQRAQKARDNLPLDRAALLTVPVPCRFDAREERTRAEEWRVIFSERLNSFYEEWAARSVEPSKIIKRITIPYVPYWSFGEGLPVVEEQSRSPESIRLYFETLASLVAHRLNHSELLVESPERYIEMAIRAGRRGEKYEYDVFLSFTRDFAENAQALQKMFEARGSIVFVADPSSVVEAKWPEPLEYGLDQSQHAVFLMGKEHLPGQGDALRRFAKQSLEEETPRMILPVVFKTGTVPNLPEFLRRSQLLMEDDISADALGKQIMEILWPTETKIPVDKETPQELKLALARLHDEDPLHKTFISFHHANDEIYKLYFEQMFSEYYDILISKAVNDRDIDPNLKTDTIRQKIRDNYLRDSTVTVVLVGSETWKRKHVDWEISSSIRNTQYSSRSGLLEILLPTYPRASMDSYNPYTIPPRLYDNIKCGYAKIYNWSDNPLFVQSWIHKAFLQRKTLAPDNSFPMFRYNRSGLQWQY